MLDNDFPHPLSDVVPLFHHYRTNDFEEDVEEALVVRTAAGSVLTTLARTNSKDQNPGWLCYVRGYTTQWCKGW